MSKNNNVEALEIIASLCADKVLTQDEENVLREALAKQEHCEPVAVRYDFDGYGYKYIDSGSGSDWQTRVKDAEPLYATPYVPTGRQPVTESHKRKPLTDEQKIILGFLDGSNPLQGIWYGEDHPAFGRAKHWWRRFLRQAFADDFAAHGIRPSDFKE